MNLLLDNKILSAGISALNANQSYPATNIQAQFLRKIFKSQNNTDTLTIEFDSLTDIDVIFWAYTNMTAMEINFYDEVDTLLEKIYFSGGSVAHYYGYPTLNLYGFDNEYYGYFDRVAGEQVYDPESWYLSQTLSVKKIEIILEADNPVFLGGFAAGMVETIRNPLATWSDEFDDKSVNEESESGQVYQLYNRPQKVYSFTIPDMNRTEANDLMDNYQDIGIGSHIWLDVTNNNHDILRPMYATLESPIEFKKSGYLYSCNIEVKEAR